ncbi:MAG: TonB-dependent receptor [Salinivirgaceae bacterium]|nr:TonB-dependent receptor [Salinivirgaceae bacterium]
MMKMYLKSAVLALPMLLLSAGVFAQAHDVGGKVLDEEQQPIPGANVIIKGTTSGTVTAGNGEFSMKAADGDVLVISYMGYVSEEVTVNGSGPYNVSLLPDLVGLDEIVVVGYGTMKKSDLTGAVASVRNEDLSNRATSDAAQALQGKAAGVQIIATNGAPGSTPDIRVRGVSSNSGSLGPLIIVDGLKVSSMQYLDPEMIESIEVLKDAASAAIYGAQAGNGVILVTTKTGKNGAADGTIFYNGQWQLSSLSRELKVMDAKQYIDFGNKMMFLPGGWEETYKYDGADVDWSKEVFEPTWSQRHTVGVQGGNDRGSFFAAINNVYNNGIFKGNKDVYKRLSMQVNAEYKIKKWFTVGTNNSIEKWSTRSISDRSDNGSAMLAAITTDPLFGPYVDPDQMDEQLTGDQKAALESPYGPGEVDEKGNYPYRAVLGDGERYYRISPISGQTQSSNPFIRRDQSDATSEGINVRGVSYFNFNPISGLVYTSRFGYRFGFTNSHTYDVPFVANEFVYKNEFSFRGEASTNYAYQWENFINYNKTFADLHDFGAMVGMSWEATHSDNVWGQATGGDILKGYEDNFRYLEYLKDGDAKSSKKNTGGTINDSRNLSYFGRLTYSYDNRYSLQANFRADAFDSSKLPKDSRWGKFPSFSAGWTASNESFIADNVNTDILSFLKLRASWGRNGNINVLTDYPYASVIKSNSDWYQFSSDYTMVYGSEPNGLANPDLKWEVSEQIDLGLDARFLNSRLSLGIDWYKKTTEGLLVKTAPLYETGVMETTSNAGEVLNKGLEIELGWKDKIGDFSYSVNANMATLHNELTKLGDGKTDGMKISGTSLQGSAITTECVVGQPLWHFLGFQFDHFNENGLAEFKDLNGDGEFKPNETDMTDLGCGLPKLTYGITINMDYKGFDFVIFGTGVAGNKILPQGWRTDRMYCNYYSWFYENAWDPETKSGKFPVISPQGWQNDVWGSDLTVFSGAYFKIKQIQLGYSLPKELLSKVYISRLRVFASLENYFTFSKYPGLDPEVANSNNAWTPSSLGIDNGTYPTAKQVIFGVNLTF